MATAAELTVEYLEALLARAAYCARMTMQGQDFRPIFDLAKRVKAFDISKLGHLAAARTRSEVRLTGQEARKLLMLALEAKRAGLPPRQGAAAKKLYRAK